MARSCSVCRHPEAGTINALLRDGRTARQVAAEYGLSYDALTRHARNHLAEGDALPARARPEGDAPPADIDPLDELTQALRVRALKGSDAASREYRLAIQAQTAAKHAATPRRALVDEAEWQTLRSALLEALQPFPEARLAVAKALAEAGA